MNNLNDFSDSINIDNINNIDFLKYSSNEKEPKLLWNSIKERIAISIFRSRIKKAPKKFPYELNLCAYTVRKGIQLFHYFSSKPEIVKQFEELPYYRDQICFLYAQRPKEATVKILGAMLGGTEGIVNSQLRKMKLESKGELKEPHRPSFITSISKNKIREKIEEYQTKNVILTIDVISEVIEKTEGRQPLLIL